MRLERLHADRDPADAGAAPRGEVGIGAIARVRLERDLARCTAEPLADPRDRSRDAVGAPQRRSATAQVDRDQLAGERIRAELELAGNRVEVDLVRRWTNLDREIAVRAPLAAPRVMEVDA
jgi:hypothetical protein